jgi:hypothetical protein
MVVLLGIEGKTGSRLRVDCLSALHDTAAGSTNGAIVVNGSLDETARAVRVPAFGVVE